MNDTVGPMARRTFLEDGILTTSAALTAAASAQTIPSDPPTASGGGHLRERLFGCIAGRHIGSPMGWAVEA